MMVSYSTNTLNGVGKIDHVPDYYSASSAYNNHPQAAFLSAMLYQQQHQQQPYQQLAYTQNLYAAAAASDPAQVAKDLAHKNYANALKMAVAHQQQQQQHHHPQSHQSQSLAHQQQSANTGVPVSVSSALSAGAAAQKSAMPYTGMALTGGHAAAAMYSQQPASQAALQRLQLTQAAAGRSPFSLPQLTGARQMQASPFQQFIRPQMPVNITAAAASNNPYYAAAAHQQFLSQQNLLYSGLTSSMANPQLTAAAAAAATSSASSMPSNYPFALSQAQAQGLSASMMQVPQITPTQTSQQSAASVLNPYKKMKTS